MAGDDGLIVNVDPRWGAEESINRFLILNVLSGLADDDISGPTVCPVSLSLSFALFHSHPL